MNALLRITGIGKLISFYRYIYFDLPRLVTFTGICLILLIGLIHLYLLPRHYEAAPYIGVSFGLLFAGSLLSSVGILRGPGWGWALGAILSAAAFAAYFVSRIWGLPGFSEAEGNWATPLGTVAFGLEALFIATYVSLITGMNVAWPDKRDWHD